jgi:hypothetical protein
MSNTYKDKELRKDYKAMKLWRANNDKWREFRKAVHRALFGLQEERPEWVTRNDQRGYSHKPSWFDNLFHTRKRRRKERALLRKCAKDLEAYDNIVFPDGQKPHIYHD